MKSNTMQVPCNDPNSFQAAFRLAETINASWKEAECVDWSEAESLWELCSAAPIALQRLVPEIGNIIAYANAHDEWDSEYVAQWPDIVIKALENADKHYEVEENGDRWDVVLTYLTGDSEWLATVESRSIADLLVTALLGVPHDMPNNADAPIQQIAEAMSRDLPVSNVPLSGQLMDVTVSLAIEMSLLYWEDIRVPVEFNQSMRDELIDLAYEQVEPTRFCGTGCNEWERGASSHTVIENSDD